MMNQKWSAKATSFGYTSVFVCVVWFIFLAGRASGTEQRHPGEHRGNYSSNSTRNPLNRSIDTPAQPLRGNVPIRRLSDGRYEATIELGGQEQVLNLDKMDRSCTMAHRETALLLDSAQPIVLYSAYTNYGSIKFRFLEAAVYSALDARSTTALGCTITRHSRNGDSLVVMTSNGQRDSLSFYMKYYDQNNELIVSNTNIDFLHSTLSVEQVTEALPNGTRRVEFVAQLQTAVYCPVIVLLCLNLQAVTLENKQLSQPNPSAASTNVSPNSNLIPLLLSSEEEEKIEDIELLQRPTANNPSTHRASSPQQQQSAPTNDTTPPIPRILPVSMTAVSYAFIANEIVNLEFQLLEEPTPELAVEFILFPESPVGCKAFHQIVQSNVTADGRICNLTFQPLSVPRFPQQIFLQGRDFFYFNAVRDSVNPRRYFLSFVVPSQGKLLLCTRTRGAALEASIRQALHAMNSEANPLIFLEIAVFKAFGTHPTYVTATPISPYYRWQNMLTPNVSLRVTVYGANLSTRGTEDTTLNDNRQWPSDFSFFRTGQDDGSQECRGQIGRDCLVIMPPKEATDFRCTDPRDFAATYSFSSFDVISPYLEPRNSTGQVILQRTLFIPPTNPLRLNAPPLRIFCYKDGSRMGLGANQRRYVTVPNIQYERVPIRELLISLQIKSIDPVLVRSPWRTCRTRTPSWKYVPLAVSESDIVTPTSSSYFLLKLSTNVMRTSVIESLASLLCVPPSVFSIRSKICDRPPKSTLLMSIECPSSLCETEKAVRYLFAIFPHVKSDLSAEEIQSVSFENPPTILPVDLGNERCASSPTAHVDLVHAGAVAVFLLILVGLVIGLARYRRMKRSIVYQSMGTEVVGAVEMNPSSLPPERGMDNPTNERTPLATPTSSRTSRRTTTTIEPEPTNPEGDHSINSNSATSNTERSNPAMNMSEEQFKKITGNLPAFVRRGN